MLAFKDFTQKVIDNPSWYNRGALEPVEDTLKRIGIWAEDKGIVPINIETTMLPFSEAGHANKPVRINPGKGYIHLIPTFRVWYNNIL